MAIVKCGECGREVSNKAQACVGCGAPVAAAAMEAAATGKPVTTTEQTSKRFKGHTAGATICLILSTIWLFGSINSGSTGLPAILTLASLIWLIWSKTSAWWHHG